MIKCPRCKTRAFTLIELLIVIAIIMFMAATAIPLYQNYGANNEVALKADEVKAMIDRAYAYSESPAQNNNCAQVSNVDGEIRIQFGSINADNFSLTDGCVIDGGGQELSSKDIILTDGFNVQFGTATKQLDRFFAFYPGTSKLYYHGVSSEIYYQIDVITISSARASWTATVTVNTNPYSSKVKINK